MKNSEYQMTFGVEIEFVFVFHQKLILAELLHLVEGEPRKPGGEFRDGALQVHELQRLIKKELSDEDRREMNRVPFAYQSSRPRYLAWGVQVDGHPHDTMVKVNPTPPKTAQAKDHVRTYRQEPANVAKEVLRSGLQSQALQYWEPSYRSDIDIGVHVARRKPSDFTNWHLIPEHVVEAHTQNALEAYLVRHKKCTTRDGPELGWGVKRPLERDSDDERPSKRLSSSVQSRESDQENRQPDFSQQSDPSHNPALPGSSLQSHDSNQENVEHDPSSRVLRSRQLPNTSFESNVSPNPADQLGTPTSPQPGLSFEIYESPTGHLPLTIPQSAGSHQSIVDTSDDENLPGDQSQQHEQEELLQQDTLQQDTLQQDTLQQDTLQQDTLQQDTLQQHQLHPNLLQNDLYQRNQEQRDRVHQSLMARNPLMDLQPQQVPVSHIPPLDISDLLEEEDQGLAHDIHPSVETPDYSPSQYLQDMMATEATIFTIHQDEIPDSQEPKATQDFQDLPQASAKAPSVSEWDSDGMELVSRVLRPTPASFTEISSLCDRLKGHPCSLHGATPSPKTGLHVHMKTQNGDIDLLTLQHLLYILAMYERYINTLHVPHRRPNSDSDTSLNELAPNTDGFERDSLTPDPSEPWPAPKEPWQKDRSLKEIRDMIFHPEMDLEQLIIVTGGEKTHIVNFIWLSHHRKDKGKKPRTIEFRQHESVLRGEMIEYWVTFCIGLLRLANHMAWKNIPAGVSAEEFPGNRNGEGYWIEEWCDTMSVWDLIEQMELEPEVVGYFMRRAAFLQGHYGERSGMADSASKGRWEDVPGRGWVWVLNE